MSFSDTLNIPNNRAPASWSNISVNSVKTNSFNADTINANVLKGNNLDVRTGVGLIKNLVCEDIELNQPLFTQTYKVAGDSHTLNLVFANTCGLITVQIDADSFMTTTSRVLTYNPTINLPVLYRPKQRFDVIVYVRDTNIKLGLLSFNQTGSFTLSLGIVNNTEIPFGTGEVGLISDLYLTYISNGKN